MIKIGGKTLVMSESFLVKDNEEIFIEETIEGWLLKITLVLRPKPDESNPTLSWQAISDNHARIEFGNWGNSLGTATQEFVNLGTTDTTNRPVLFAACNHKIGTINRLDFQLYLGEKK